MKRFLLLVVVILSMSINVFSQGLSAYGVSLGEKKYKVENSLENKGKKVKYSTNKKGEALLKISNPIIGGASFDTGTFGFNDDDKLRFITFSLMTQVVLEILECLGKQSFIEKLKNAKILF